MSHVPHRWRLLAALLLLALSLVLPAVAFAADEAPTEEPPSGEDSGEGDAQSAPAEEAAPAAEAEATEAAPEGEAAAESTDEEAPGLLAEATETVLDLLGIDPTPEPEGADADAEPAADEIAPLELVEVVEAMAETGMQVIDAESGETLPLATEEAADILGGSDPYFFNGTNWVGYTSGTSCPAPVTVCNTGVVNPVQTAISAASSLSNPTVYVETGTYQEQVFINYPMTLQAVGAVTILAPATINNPNEFSSGANTNQAIVLVQNTDGVTIDGFTIDGANGGNNDYRYTGIGFNNAGGVISNNTVTGITDTPFSGAQHGNGIYVYNNDGGSHTINILYNLITDYQKNGITVVDGATANTTVDISGNTVVGIGPTTITAQNGIQTSGVDGVINNNTVTDNWYTPATWTAAGILTFGGHVDITNNNLDGNQSGIYDYGTTGDITGNTVNDGTWGITDVGGDSNIDNNQVTNQVPDVNGYDGLGIYSDNPNSSANGNSFGGNTYDLYFEGASGEVFDATGNWWGCPQGYPTCGVVDSSAGSTVDTGSPLASDPFAAPVGPAAPALNSFMAATLLPNDAMLFQFAEGWAVYQLVGQPGNLEGQFVAWIPNGPAQDDGLLPLSGEPSEGFEVTMTLLTHEQATSLGLATAPAGMKWYKVVWSKPGAAARITYVLMFG